MATCGGFLRGLALMLLFAGGLRADGSAISAVRVTDDGPGFVAEWTTGTPMTSAVHNSAGAWLAGDAALVTAHRVVYQCAWQPLCHVTCDASGQCSYQCLGVGPTDCAFPSQLIFVASAPAPDATPVVDDNHGNFYITHLPELVSWREIF